MCGNALWKALRKALRKALQKAVREVFHVAMAVSILPHWSSGDAGARIILRLCGPQTSKPAQTQRNHRRRDETKRIHNVKTI